MEEQQIIQQGTRAELLLKDDTFNGVIKGLLDQYVGVFFGTDPMQQDERSVAYFSARAVQDIVNTLNQQVLMKKQIIETGE
jgi:hypothetical protein